MQIKDEADPNGDSCLLACQNERSDVRREVCSNLIYGLPGVRSSRLVVILLKAKEAFDAIHVVLTNSDKQRILV